MKNRYLPETDIANLAFQIPSLKEKFLSAWIRPRSARGSYDPYRNTYGDAVNRQLPLYPDGQVSTPWTKLEQSVRKLCRGNEQLLEMNLPIAKATHAFASFHKMTAQPVDVSPITLVPGQRYSFGNSMILRYDGGASIMFPDLRRTGGLSPHARRVAWSVMHARMRENFPEYSELRLECWRHLNNESRAVKVYRHEGQPLYTYSELAADFAETYAILNMLRLGADEDRKRHGGDDLGPLFRTAD